MSDKIIRLGGSQADKPASVHNLITYLKEHQGRRFIVLSAYPEIQRVIAHALNQASVIDVHRTGQKLKDLFSGCCRREPTPDYIGLVDQVTGILRGIGLTGDYSEGLKDLVLTFGEKLTAEIFRAEIAAEWPEAEILLPEVLGMAVTSEFGNATYTGINRQLAEQLAGALYLVPGSYGINSQGKIARTGRSAADYTAAWLTQQLKAERLELWGTDRAFFRTDPAITSQPPLIQRLTYTEASELAYFDHYSFHPRTVEPLEAEHIPIRIISTTSGEGMVDTTINTETYIEPQVVKSIASTDDISLLQINGPGVGLKPGILARITSLLTQSGINIKSVITSQISIQILLEANAGPEACQRIKQADFPSVREVDLASDVSLIGVIGHGLGKNSKLLATILGAVANAGVQVILSGSGASELATYLIINRSEKAKCVRAIYNAFFNPNEGSSYDAKTGNSKK